MSGGNGIKKTPSVSRENQFVNFQELGISYRQRDPLIVTAATPAALTAAQFFNDITFDPTSGAAYTTPNGLLLIGELAIHSVNKIGNSFTQIVENQRATPLTITNASLSPTSVVLPANSISELTWELISQTAAPYFQLISNQLISSGGAPVVVGIPPGTVDGEVLQWSTVTNSWRPSTALPVGTSTRINAVLPYGGDVTFELRDTFSHFNIAGIPLPAASAIGVNVTSVAPPGFTLAQQGGILVGNANGQSATVGPIVGSGNFWSNVTAINLQPDGAIAPDVLWHMMGTTNGAGNIVCGFGYSGQMWCSSSNVFSSGLLKNNITEYPVDSRSLRNVRAVRFNYNADKLQAETSIGLIAEELEAALPQGIVTKPAAGGSQHKAISQMPLIAFLLGAVKDLEARISVLENE